MPDIQKKEHVKPFSELKQCRACKHDVSSSASKCMNCGCPHPAMGETTFGMFSLAFLILAVVLFFYIYPIMVSIF